MKNRSGTICATLLGGIMVACLVAAPAAYGSDSERHQRIGGMDIYLGVIPAQLVTNHAGMHDGMKGKRHVYHVLVALFDDGSGTRITDATVWATVTDHALSATKKTLGPMHTADAVSFGNFFRMDAPGRYHIMLEIQRSGPGHPAKAGFVYRRPKD